MTNIVFKYQPVSDAGQATGWRSKKGVFDGDQLKLDGSTIQATAVTHTVLVENVLVLMVLNADSQPTKVALLIHSGNAQQLKTRLDHVRSAAFVAASEKESQSQGQGGLFRKEICPNCSATLNLSQFDPTPQLFCDYCDTVSTVPKQLETPSNESEYRLCEHCGMYSRPRKFTEFYFYFLFVFYGWWTKHSMRCPACMRGAAWKMLGINFLFVLGIIPSIYQLVRAYASDKVSGPFSGLHAANLNATRRKYSAATKTYQAILERVPVAAGIHYNLGLALVQNAEWERAAAAFELSLDDCSNYRYAAGGLMHCYETLGRTEELADMQQQWGAPS